MESVLKDLPALFCSLVPEGSFPGGPIVLEQLEFCFPKIQGPDFTLCLTHIPQGCELQQCPRLAPILTSPISSLALVTVRSSIAYPLGGLSITWLKKLSLMHSRSVLDCLQLAVLLFQQMLGWLKFPSRIVSSIPPGGGQEVLRTAWRHRMDEGAMD
ncbi:hypothetical protein QYF61_006055 [Mycteria americana]|uniref:Uncharacterized protein n=1 Tax=Mycteria americana TaxID=33587 RepID=A0AAN7RX23_MYCAM|nr:hypothetical protein QYF61_006055 [Mycteria americana]